jgi:hypothetical protein
MGEIAQLKIRLQKKARCALSTGLKERGKTVTGIALRARLATLTALPGK